MNVEAKADNAKLPSELSNLNSLINEKVEAFALGDHNLENAALQATKYIFDLTLKSEEHARVHLAELLKSIEPSQAPQTRSQARAAAKSGDVQKPTINKAILNITPLSSLFTTGMDDDQIWAQLDLKAKNVCETLEDAFDAGDVDARGMRDIEDEDEEDELDSDEMDGMDIDDKEWEDMDEMDDDDDDSEESGDDESEDSEQGINTEHITELRNASSEEDTDEDGDGDDQTLFADLDAGPSSRRSEKRSGKKHPELDDQFFSLEAFNAEIEEAESRTVSSGALSKDSDDESENEDGLDFFAPVDDKEPEDSDMEVDSTEAYYKDFFEPPRGQRKGVKKASKNTPKPKNTQVRFHDEVKVKIIKNKGKGLPVSAMNIVPSLNDDDEDEDDDEEDELTLSDNGSQDESSSKDEDEEENEEGDDEEGDGDEGREAIDRLKDDLFADDDEEEDRSQLSTHEKRMSALREQIAALEAENVAEKDWVLKGEVTSRARPQNALLEEDLEFERVMKPVPVVTDDVVQDLESRIKARILETRFDDVVRKRPVDDKPFLPSRLFELQDTKSKESLAQIYENEYVETQTGKPVDDRDGKLQKEHEEIEKMWEGICYQLDALCNAHFVPKLPKASITTVSNASAVTLESALPTSKSASSILAPEEVYTPSSSDLRAKSELTPAEKRALRTKERKKRKKQRDLLDKSVDKYAKANGIKSVKKQKETALKSMVKNGKGVTVIGKKSQDAKKKKAKS